MAVEYEKLDLSREQAIAIAETRWWRSCTPRQIVGFQLFTDKLCMNFSEYHRALEKVLDRPVYTHEMGASNEISLIGEFLGDRKAPTLSEIIGLIPEEKRIVIAIEEAEDELS